MAITLTNRHLAIIVFAQFAGTSLWFAGNAVLPDLMRTLPGLTGWITSAVQIGFVGGTLLYALLAIPDRFPATRVFVVSVGLAALANVGWLLGPVRAETLLLSRFVTGFFLAGVYPVGMKIAADWFRPVLGRAMGFLVGALVVGTAFPHLIRGLGAALPYRIVVLSVSALAIFGGLLLAVFIPSKPVTKQPAGFQFSRVSDLFRPSDYRPAMLGYFGHMWELYTLWAFMPMLIAGYSRQHPTAAINMSVWSFFAIAAGALGCVVGGFWALASSSGRVARTFLLASGLCIALVPWLLPLPPWTFGLFLLAWGLTAAGDSPQFSTMVASQAPLANRGTVITLVVSIGFLLTVISIQFMAWLVNHVGASVWLFYVLLPGPLLGVWASWSGRNND